MCDNAFPIYYCFVARHACIKMLINMSRDKEIEKGSDDKYKACYYHIFTYFILFLSSFLLYYFSYLFVFSLFFISLFIFTYKNELYV